MHKHSHHTHTQDPHFCVFLSFRAPSNSSTIIHLLPLPHHSKADGIRFRWSQEAPQGPEGYESCWGLDNVLLVNAAHRTPLMEDNLDPPNTANWLFFPGATVKVVIKWWIFTWISLTKLCVFVKTTHSESAYQLHTFLLTSMRASPREMLFISMVVRELATALPPPETLTCTGRKEGATGRKILRAPHQSK